MSHSIANGSPEWMPLYQNKRGAIMNTFFIHHELVAIAHKLDKIDSSDKSDALDKDYADLQAKISQTRDLLAAADTEVKVGDDAKDIVKLLQDMKSEIAEVKDKQDKQCCTIS
ncbi:hypothetical protein ScalyP_jg2729 [Parmales sp. scaly parma]|nr:hypothetical protein ScalyP_jg2729 [Parmales sp. scaly parma]